MAQTKVTEYFSNRKRTFGLIQPSKKLKLDPEYQVESKTSLINPSFSKPQHSLTTSSKRQAKRKHVAASAGNIKSFLERAASHKMPKLGASRNSNNTSKASNCSLTSVSKNDVTQTAENEASPTTFIHETHVQHQKIANALTNLPVDPNVVNTKFVVPDKCSEQSQETKLLKLKLSKVKASQSNVTLGSTVLDNVENVSNIKKNKQSLLAEKIQSFKKAVREVQAPEKQELCAPAYERFKSLSLEDSESSLVVPFKYKVLEELFRATETVVSMLYNRKEVCNLAKVKVGVQQMIKRNFDRKVLGQIVTVFPSAYTISLEKGLTAFSSGKAKSSDSLLTITPNITSKHNLNGTQQSVQMTPHVLLERRKHFHVKLLLIAKEHHEKFLSNLETPLCIASDRLMRWHPKFPVDDVPDIVPAPLPEFTDLKISTVQDVLEKVKGVVGERIGKALKAVSEEKAPVPIQPVAPTRIASGALKGISQALLDKIRNKENAKMTREMLRSPDSQKKIEMLSNLPELVRILRMFFVTEKRAVIALEDAMVKIADSFHSAISSDDVEKHLRLLSQVVPKWLIFLTIPKGVFIKVDKRMDVTEIIKVINAEIVKEKS